MRAKIYNAKINGKTTVQTVGGSVVITGTFDGFALQEGRGYRCAVYSFTECSLPAMYVLHKRASFPKSISC